MKNYVFDACAIIAFVNDEEGADKVEDLLQKAFAGDAALSMNIYNLTEVYYGYLKELGKEQADEILRVILAYPIRIITVIAMPMFEKAASIKAAYPLSLADAYACATAWWTDSTLVTCDHGELEAVEERESIPFLWIRPKPSEKPKR